MGNEEALRVPVRKVYGGDGSKMIRLPRSRRLRPSRRAVNPSVCVADWDFVRQLADGGKVSRNVPVDGRMMDKVGTTIFGVKDNHLPPEFLPDEVKGSGKVRVPADDICFHGYEEGPGSFKREPRSALAEPCGWMSYTIANSAERRKGGGATSVIGRGCSSFQCWKF